LAISLIEDDRRLLHCKAVANDSSTTQFLVGVIDVSVTVKSGVMSTQLLAREFVGLDNKSKKSTAIRVFNFVFCAPSDFSNRMISLNMFSAVKPAGRESQPKRRLI
jgi:hypothetical protein